MNHNKSIKLAILGDSSLQLLVKQLKVKASENLLKLEVLEEGFNQIEIVIEDGASDLYAFQPDLLVIFNSVEKLKDEFYQYPIDSRADFSAFKKNQIFNLLNLASSRLPNTKIIFTNYTEINDGIFGNNANKNSKSLLRQIRVLNLELMNYASNSGNTFILDLSIIQNQIGRERFYDPRLYVNASMAYSLEANDLISQNMLSMMGVFEGMAKKCIILDLDNTLWGGIIGDDGIERIQLGDLSQGRSFGLLQRWAKELKNRGIILAICSKNTDSVAREPFLSHPEMILRLDDISVFIANWDDKATNIRKIQEQLNIGLDSMVFLDDNKFERELVKSILPEVCIPNLPEDPAEYLGFLEQSNLFEAGTLSELDADRTQLLKTEIERKKLEASFNNQEEFLKNLDMKAKFESFTPFNTPRISQLSERSNQYNLRTIRYSEAEITAISSNLDYSTIAIQLEDRLGNHGLISVIILKQEYHELFIENWFMSCRVLKRGVEYSALNEIISIAKKRGCQKIIGEYLPTKKNALVKNHYEDLGFSAISEFRWQLNLSNFRNKLHHIKVMK